MLSMKVQQILIIYFNLKLGIDLHQKFNSTIGVNNIFNTVYTPHTF